MLRSLLCSRAVQRVQGAQAGYNAGQLANLGYAQQAKAGSYSPWADLFSGAAQSPAAGAAVQKVAGLFGWGS